MIQNGESDEVFIQNSPSIFNFVFVAVPFSLHLKNLPLKEDIQPEYISEAIQYRSLDRNLWTA
jgi:hypothetical protein